MKTHRIVSIILAGVALVVAGCQTATQTFFAQYAVMRATEEVVKDRPESAKRAVALADFIDRSITDDGSVTVAELAAEVTKRIAWDQLKSPTDRAMLESLIQGIAAEIEAKIGTGQIPPDQATKVKIVAKWIRDAASPYTLDPVAPSTSFDPGQIDWSTIIQHDLRMPAADS